MAVALLVAAGVALAGGLLALLFLPSRAAAGRSPQRELPDVVEPAATPMRG
jgi:hypothetical protein